MIIWLWLKEGFGAGKALLVRYPWQVLCAALFVAALWFYWAWSDTKSDFADFRESTAAAAKQAEVAQAAVNHEPARKSALVAEKSNAEAPAYYARVADAARVQNRPGRTCPTPVPGADSAEPSVHGPDPDTILVPKTEYDQLTYATARGLEMQAEANELIRLGVAVGE